MHSQARRTNSNIHWQDYRQVRNQITSLKRQLQTEYYQELDEKASDPKKFGSKEWWKLVRQFMSKKEINSNEIPPIKHNGNILYSNKDKADIFNEFFAQQSTLESSDDSPPDLVQFENEIALEVLTSTEVKNVILNLDKQKASGPDAIHNRLLIAAVNQISDPLTLLFNRSLQEGHFPTQWKHAHVTPIYKKGPRELCNNYRPISLLSCVGKVLERCIHKHIISFLRQNDILSPSQSGFIPGDSTINQLLVIYNDLCSAFDEGITTQAIYFDISKAFDRVWHEGLLAKLKSVGIRGKLHAWFCSYLTDRSQNVVLKGEKSGTKIIKAGVPQGSVLGPLLFLVYINDIVKDIVSVIKLFADDTSMSLALRDYNVRGEIVNSDLENISQWAKLWKVKFIK